MNERAAGFYGTLTFKSSTSLYVELMVSSSWFFSLRD
jgi:hypothetical protein